MAEYIKPDGTMLARFISPGQGASAYYEKEQLIRDAPLFKGAHVYINHPSKSEAQDRPERDWIMLAGEITEVPTFRPQGPAGPGLYGPMRIVPSWQSLIKEKASLSGMSLRAHGSKVIKDKGGQKVMVAEKFLPGLSVDVVTVAGAGGKILPLVEAGMERARQSVTKWMQDAEFIESDGRSEEERFIEWAMNEGKQLKGEEENMVDEAKFKEVQDKNIALLQENEKLKTAVALRDARDEAFKLFEAYEQRQKVARKPALPDMVKTRLIEALVRAAPVKEGVLDKDAFTKTVEAAITEAEKEVAEIIAKKPGIAGMGETASDGGRKHLEEVLTEMHRGLGKSEKEAKELAEAAARGR